MLSLCLCVCLVRIFPRGGAESGSVLFSWKHMPAAVFLSAFPMRSCRAGHSLGSFSRGWQLQGVCISTFALGLPFWLHGRGSHCIPMACLRTGGGGAASPRLQCTSICTAVAKPSFYSLEITLRDTKERSDLCINSRFSCHNISLFFFPKSVITCLCPATCCFTTNIILTQALWVKIIPLN